LLSLVARSAGLHSPHPLSVGSAATNFFCQSQRNPLRVSEAVMMPNSPSTYLLANPRAKGASLQP